MQFAEKSLRATGSVMPMFIVHTKTGSHVIATPWKDDKEKALCRQMVRVFCIAHNATALTFLSEVWMRRLMRHPRETDAEFQVRQDAVAPSEAEDRTEAVMAIAAWRDDAGERQIVFEAREIERRLNGKPSGLAAMPTSKEYGGLEGRMVEIFPDRAPSALEQATAKAVLDQMGAAMSLHKLG
jgi:hypothetical protein